MFKDTDLIKVKAMSKNMAKQVTVVVYHDEIGKKILEGFRADTVRPTAWACGEVLDGIPDNVRAWLVSFEGNWYWISAPYGGKVADGSPEWMQVCSKNLPQVFIG
jgi:hypothetical protein